MIYEFHYISEGICPITINDTSTCIPANGICIIPQNTIHYFPPSSVNCKEFGFVLSVKREKNTPIFSPFQMSIKPSRATRKSGGTWKVFCLRIKTRVSARRSKSISENHRSRCGKCKPPQRKILLLFKEGKTMVSCTEFIPLYSEFFKYLE